jgi:hypothetical protein
MNKRSRRCQSGPWGLSLTIPEPRAPVLVTLEVCRVSNVVRRLRKFHAARRAGPTAEWAAYSESLQRMSDNIAVGCRLLSPPMKQNQTSTYRIAGGACPPVRAPLMCKSLQTSRSMLTRRLSFLKKKAFTDVSTMMMSTGAGIGALAHSYEPIPPAARFLRVIFAPGHMRRSQSSTCVDHRPFAASLQPFPVVTEPPRTTTETVAFASSAAAACAQGHHASKVAGGVNTRSSVSADNGGPSCPAAFQGRSSQIRRGGLSQNDSIMKSEEGVRTKGSLPKYGAEKSFCFARDSTSW